MDPIGFLLALDEANEEAGRNYEISSRVDSHGNLKIVFNLDTEPGFHRLWVDGTTFLPVRLQFVSTQFPEYGAEVVLTEYEFHDFGVRFGVDLFKIEPTDAELQKLGLTRESFQSLPDGVTSIEIEGQEGRSVVVDVYDDLGHRVIKGTLPLAWVEQPVGDLTFNLSTNDGIAGAFTVRMNGGVFSLGSSKGFHGFIKENGGAGVTRSGKR